MPNLYFNFVHMCKTFRLCNNKIVLKLTFLLFASLWLFLIWFFTHLEQTLLIYRKRKGKPLPKKEEIPGWKTHAQTHENLIHFGDHRCLSWSEESKFMWTCGSPRISLFFNKSLPFLCLFIVLSILLYFPFHFFSFNLYFTVLFPLDKEASVYNSLSALYF